MQYSNNIFMHSKRITAPTNNTTPHRRPTAAAAQACAACKYQRRKCAADCILAPYFPHDRQRQFLNAHRLFGVSNIVKIIARLNPPPQAAAMRTIVFHSEARAADPVGGCYRMIRDLEQQIDLATAELEIVLHHLALCRTAAEHGKEEEEAPPHHGGGDSNDVVIIDDVNSWSCMDDMNVHVHAHAESSSSSFDHDHDFKIILDNLSREDNDDDNDGYKFDCHANILPSNHGILIEANGTLIKEEDGHLNSYIEENDVKPATENRDQIENIENDLGRQVKTLLYPQLRRWLTTVEKEVAEVELIDGARELQLIVFPKL